MKCPLEPDIKTSLECSHCYASLRHVPCPMDLGNPEYLMEYHNVTVGELQRQHPEWSLNGIVGEEE